MSYTLNNIDIKTAYGIIAGHVPSSNIAVEGIFDLSQRIGQTHYEWAEGSLEPWVSADEILFGGRDIKFYGSIFGSNGVINDYVQALYDEVENFTSLVVFSTPYGDYSVQVKSIVPDYYPGGCKIAINFREPVVSIPTVTLPAEAESTYTIDSIPFASFGLYYAKGSGVRSLSELKQQLFTKYGSEGYQMSRRKARDFSLNGTIIGSSLVDFKAKIAQIAYLFSSPGMRELNINDEIAITCFAAQGFSLDSVYLSSNGMIGRIKINLVCTVAQLLNPTADSTLVTADDTTITADAT